MIELKFWDRARLIVIVEFHVVVESTVLLLDVILSRLGSLRTLLDGACNILARSAGFGRSLCDLIGLELGTFGRSIGLRARAG